MVVPTAPDHTVPRRREQDDAPSLVPTPHAGDGSSQGNDGKPGDAVTPTRSPNSPRLAPAAPAQPTHVDGAAPPLHTGFSWL